MRTRIREEKEKHDNSSEDRMRSECGGLVENYKSIRCAGETWLSCKGCLLALA